jgi:hypothetical protein
MTPLGKFLLFAGIVGVAYVVFIGDHSETKKGTRKQPPVAGWEQLDACSPMQTLDDTRELTFIEDHTIKLEEREAKTGRALGPSTLAGTWAFEESTHRYFVTLADQQKSYALVQPENSEVCILMNGDLGAANLAESWFGRTLQDLYGDLEPPDRY